MKPVSFSLSALALTTLLCATAGAECIPGADMLANEKDPTRVAIGQDLVSYESKLTDVALSRIPDFADTQIYLFVHSELGDGPAIAADWCYDTLANQVKILHQPLRMTPIYAFGDVEVPEGSELWVGYHSSQEENEECMPGLFLNYLERGPDGSTYGQDMITYQPGMSEARLSKMVTPGHQIYVGGPGGMWLYGLDWCFAPSSNSIRFQKSPPRGYNVGGIPGMELEAGDILWVGYTSPDGVSRPIPAAN